MTYQTTAGREQRQQTYQQQHKQLVQLVHIAKQQLQMAEESYRALLAHHGHGKTSSTQLTVTELMAVRAAMVKLGFKVTPGKTKTATAKPSPKVDERDVIRAIWKFMFDAGFIKDGSDNGLNGWVQRQTESVNAGAGIAKLEWLTPDHAVYVLEALKKWQRRCVYKALEQRGCNVWPQIGYRQLMDKWQKHGGAA